MIEIQANALDPEGPPSPPMCDAWLDEASLANLFDDLADCTEILSCQVKAGQCVQIGEAGVPLELARELISTSQVRGVQIRYRFQNSEWCDTIMRINDRYRLIRCQYL